MDQGYITLAVGEQRYFEMALNLSLSVKAKDPHRPICLVHDGNTELSPYRDHFDHFVVLPPSPDYRGVANKLRLYDVSPYQETMFLDSDCLIVKSDMDRHWAKLSVADFNVAGDVLREGSWYDLDISQTCRRLNIAYMCVMNSGVFYFRKSQTAHDVFATANALYGHREPALTAIHQRQPGQVADEPFLGAAMARHGLLPAQYSAEEGSIMVTSWNARKYDADLSTEHSEVIKATSRLSPYRFLPFGGVHHSPTVMHFIGLKPKKVYNRLTNGLRDDNGVNRLVW